MHAMHIMNHSGDQVITWNPADEMTTAEANRRFDEMLTLGCFAEQCDATTGSAGVQLKGFNPQAERIIIRPPLAGG